MTALFSARPSISILLSNPVKIISRFYVTSPNPSSSSLPGSPKLSSSLLSDLTNSTKNSNKSSHTTPRTTGYDADATRIFNLSSTGSAASLQQITPPTLDQRWSRLLPSNSGTSFTKNSARSVSVRNSDVGLAFRKLNRILQENNIKRELKRQERFESPSNKRVRLNSERHRRRYKVAVGKGVAMAMRMKD